MRATAVDWTQDTAAMPLSRGYACNLLLPEGALLPPPLCCLCMGHRPNYQVIHKASCLSAAGRTNDVFSLVANCSVRQISQWKQGLGEWCCISYQRSFYNWWEKSGGWESLPPPRPVSCDLHPKRLPKTPFLIPPNIYRTTPTWMVAQKTLVGKEKHSTFTIAPAHNISRKVGSSLSLHLKLMAVTTTCSPYRIN